MIGNCRGNPPEIGGCNRLSEGPVGRLAFLFRFTEYKFADNDNEHRVFL